MIADLFDERIWRKRGIEATVKILGHVDEVLGQIKDQAGRRIEGLERARAEVRKVRERVEAKVSPARDAAA